MHDSERIARLEHELATLRSELAGSDAPLSRRHLLRRLSGAAVAGAGLAVGGAALETRSADATQVAMSTGVVNNAGDEGTAITSSDEVHTLRVANTGTGTALLATAGSGLALNATSAGTLAAVIDHTNPSGTALAVSSPSIGVAVRPPTVEDPNMAYGVLVERAEIGMHVLTPGGGGDGLYVHISSGSGFGIRVTGPGIPLALPPRSSDDPPSTGAHTAGEFVVAQHGGLLECIEGGEPGRWVRVGFNPLSPKRIVDTRTGQGSLINPYAGQTLAAGGVLTVPIVGVTLGLGQLPVPLGASAVVLNVTATSVTEPGFLTVFPADLINPPTASNVNFEPGHDIANQVTVKLGTTHAAPGIKIKNGTTGTLGPGPGTTDVIVDLAGFFV